MTKKRIAFLFPGQGAQYVGMGKDFYEASPAAREIFQQADELLKKNLSKTIFEGPEENLIQTVNCQTAIFINSLAILAHLKSQYPELVPAVCAGLALANIARSRRVEGLVLRNV